MRMFKIDGQNDVSDRQAKEEAFCFIIYKDLYVEFLEFVKSIQGLDPHTLTFAMMVDKAMTEKPKKQKRQKKAA